MNFAVMTAVSSMTGDQLQRAVRQRFVQSAAKRRGEFSRLQRYSFQERSGLRPKSLNLS
jgi:hypothetical protein